MAENEVVVTTGKAVKVGDNLLPLKDGGGPVHYVDLFTEFRVSDGNVAVSLATGVWDDGNVAEAVVCTRFRMPLSVAQAFNALLSQAINEALKPVDKSQAN